jgi:hypothetical protein
MSYTLVGEPIIESNFEKNPAADFYSQHLRIETTLDLNQVLRFNFGTLFSFAIYNASTMNAICEVNLAVMYEVENRQNIDESIFLSALQNTFRLLKEHFNANSNHQIFIDNPIQNPIYKETLEELKSGLISLLN